MELKGKKMNCLGDSITEGHGLSASGKHFFTILKERCGLAEARNYGVGGSRIARQTNPNPGEAKDWDFCYRAQFMDDDADIITVFGGTNDYGHGDAPLGCMSDRTDLTFYGALHVLFRRLINKYPAATIIVFTPTHRGYENSPYGDGSRRAGEKAPLKKYVEIIREVAQFYSLPVLDLYAMGGMQPDIDVNRVRYMPDGLHPNDAGHELIADRLEGLLKSL